MEPGSVGWVSSCFWASGCLHAVKVNSVFPEGHIENSSGKAHEGMPATKGRESRIFAIMRADNFLSSPCGQLLMGPWLATSLALVVSYINKKKKKAPVIWTLILPWMLLLHYREETEVQGHCVNTHSHRSQFVLCPGPSSFRSCILAAVYLLHRAGEICPGNGPKYPKCPVIVPLTSSPFTHWLRSPVLWYSTAHMSNRKPPASLVCEMKTSLCCVMTANTLVSAGLICVVPFLQCSRQTTST